MAIAYDDDYANSTVDATSSTWNHTCGAGASLLVVAVRGHNGAADVVTGVTYNGSALTRIGSAYRGNNDRWCSFWYITSPTAGSHNVVVTNSTAAIIIACSVSYTGAGTPTTTVTDTQDGTTIATSLTTVADNSWVLMLAGNDSNPPTAGANTVVRSYNADGVSIVDSGAPVSPAGNLVLNVTAGFAHWAFIKIEVPATGGASAKAFPFPPLSRRLQGIYTR